MRIALLYLAGDIERIAVVGTRHTYNQIEHRIAKLLPRILLGRHLSEAWRIAKTQTHVFIKYFLVYTAVVFKHKGIVRIGHKKHVEDTLGHKVNKLRIFKIKLV